MRLAVTSAADASVLEAVWSGVSGVMARVGAWTVGQIDVFFANFTPAAGESIGVAAPILLAGVALWYAGATITDLIGLAAKLAK
jgi:hypothetical protein